VELVVTEVSQIQRYIFGSNRMRENVGASYLVTQATEGWALEAFKKAAPKNNLCKNGTAELDDNKQIEMDRSLDAEILYVGGGNFVALFRQKVTAQNFIQTLSRRILTDAPELQLVVACQEYDWNENGISLYKALTEVLSKLESNKRALVPSVPLLGQGVAAVCHSTGLPAVLVHSIGKDDYLVSAEVHAKNSNVELARGRLTGIVPPPEDYCYPVENIDLLGRTRGEHSYIAVVHIDGNDMGQRKKKIGQKHAELSQNREYVKAIRKFSLGVKKSAEKALKQTIDKLAENIIEEKGKKIIAHYCKDEVGKEIDLIARVELSSVDSNIFLPILPIVYGGDDLTFICDGRLALSLAVEYIRFFEQETQKNLKEKITSCAGIAIVKSHYPFAQAYRLAEGLCQSAKNYYRALKTGEKGCSCMDWHLAPSGFSGDIKKIRELEYAVKDGSLSLRPVTLGNNDLHEVRAWPVIEKGALAFQKPEWFQRRNKAKALQEALREGAEYVEQFRFRFNGSRELPDLQTSMRNFLTRGWHGHYCGYFDALELLDWYIPLGEEK
jgi:hypothetical protein